MIKRVGVFFLVVMLFSKYSLTVFACDEEQTNVYVRQILFGDNYNKYENNSEVKKLLNALYLCCEQANKSGERQLEFLKKAKVGNVPRLEKINIDSNCLFECSHKSWNYVSQNNKKAQEARKKLLRKTITNVFEFGWFYEKFNINNEKIDSFAALLYYSHILADYLATNPEDTALSVKNYDILAYLGNAYIKLNGNRPTFKQYQKHETKEYEKYSDLDAYGRCQSVIANIGLDTLEQVELSNVNFISSVLPSGWRQKKYESIMPDTLYIKCHLLAHQIGGDDIKNNLVTVTQYLNEAMTEFEDKIVKYVEKTKNHVLYRATPVYRGSDALASGIQLEAYSIEDGGKGICFNVYLYNIQPGVSLDYSNGNSVLTDETIGKDLIPFAEKGSNAQNPDLMYEIVVQLEKLFVDQKETKEYKNMINDLEKVAKEARNAGGDKSWEDYQNMKKYQYEYMKKLSEYVPKLLKNEEFFKEVF